MMDNNSLWKKVIDIITILILGFGVIVGYKALTEYHNQNNAQMINSLLGSDTEIIRIMIENKYLQGLLAISPKDKDVKITANQMVEIIINNINDNICHNWKDIPELYNNIFRVKDFNNDNKQKLREAIIIMETVLDDILSAYEAYNFKLINKEDYKTYIGTFSEMGRNPLFLCAFSAVRLSD